MEFRFAKDTSYYSNYHPNPYRIWVYDDLPDGQGEMLTDWFPVNLNINSGSQGAQLNIQVTGINNNMVMNNDKEKNFNIKKYLGKYIVLKNIKKEEILFIGNIISYSSNFSATTNNIDLTCDDLWYRLSDTLVKIDDPNIIFAGQYLAYINSGYYIKYYYDYITDKYKTGLYQLNPPALPTNKSGTRLVDLDSRLFGVRYDASLISAVNVYTADLVNEIVNTIPNHTCFLRYNDNKATITLKEVNKKKHTLVVGNMNGNPSFNFSANVIDINISHAYNSVKNKIIGEGDYELEHRAFEIKKGWTDAEEYEYLNDSRVRTNPNYSHVGKLFIIPSNEGHVVPKTWNHSYSRLGGTDQTNEFIVYEFNDMNNKWIKSDVTPNVIHHSGVNAINNQYLKSYIYSHSFKFGNNFLVWFDSPQFFNGYTKDELEAMETDSTIEIIPSLRVKKIKLQAFVKRNKITDYLEDLNYYPIKRTGYKSTNYSKVVDYESYNWDTERQLIQERRNRSIDETPALRKDIMQELEDLKYPDVSASISLWKIYDSFEVGDGIDRIISQDGTVLVSDLKLVINNITHDFSSFRTSLTCGKYSKEFFGAII